jgi:hypothetical protein
MVITIEGQRLSSGPFQYLPELPVTWRFVQTVSPEGARVYVDTDTGAHWVHVNDTQRGVSMASPLVPVGAL